MNEAMRLVALSDFKSLALGFCAWLKKAIEAQMI